MGGVFRLTLAAATDLPRSHGSRCGCLVAELALREMRTPSLLVALDYLELLAEVKPSKLEPAALRSHGRLEAEASVMSLAESQLALAALASLCNGERDAVEILRRLLRRVGPMLIRSIG